MAENHHNSLRFAEYSLKLDFLPASLSMPDDLQSLADENHEILSLSKEYEVSIIVCFIFHILIITYVSSLLRMQT